MLKRAWPVLISGLSVGLSVGLSLALTACETTPATPPPDYYRPPTAAEQACVNQGFVRGSDGYEQCMARQNSAGKPPPPPVVEPKAGVFAFKDEFGFRYDALGNRIDAQGHIISARTP